MPGMHWASSSTGAKGATEDDLTYFRIPALKFEAQKINPRFATCSYDSEDTAAPLYFTEKALGSRFFGSLRPEIVADLAAKPYARESHSHGLSLASFDANKVLKEEYEVLSLSTDPEGEVRPWTDASIDL